MTDTSDVSPNLGLPFYQTKLNEFEVQHNEALLMLDALVMLAVIDRDLSAPPGSPALGDRYLVKATGTGDFTGQDHRIAQYDTGGWNFYAPQKGWTCYVQDEQVLLAWSGTAWTAALDVLGGISEIQNLSLLGVGTAADSTNPLSAKLNNVLWTAKTVAEGGDGTLRYKLSKESAAKTLSFLFQDNFSGRAEIGLIGDDDLHFKTSADGSAWTDALTLDKTTGAAKFNSSFCLTGDITPSQINADQNDYNPAGLSTASVLRLATDASRNLTGLSGGADGRIAAVINVGSNVIVLKDANTGSSAANRFAFGADVSLAAKQSAVLWYDATDTRWKLLAGPQASGGSGPADLDITLAELSMGVADALNVAQFLGSAGNRFADSFDALTYVDVAGATNLDTGTAGQLKPSASGSSDAVPTMTSSTTSGVTISSNDDGGAELAWKAFDDNASTDWGSVVSGFPDTLTVDFGASNNKTVATYTVKALSSTTYVPVAWTLAGSNDNSSYTTLDTQSGQSFSAAEKKTYTVSSPASYRYYKLTVTDSAAHTYVQIAELELITAGTTSNMTAKSTAFTAAAVPASIKLVAMVEETDTITLNTDLIFAVSRDGGTTFTSATMTDRFTASSIHVLESAAIDVTSQPSGTSVKWKVTTANNKLVKIHGISVYWS